MKFKKIDDEYDLYDEDAICPHCGAIHPALKYFEDLPSEEYSIEGMSCASCNKEFLVTAIITYRYQTATKKEDL